MFTCEGCGIQKSGHGRCCGDCRKICRICGVNIGGRPERLCAVCTNKLGLCTTCKYRPQDRPGYKECSICKAVRREKGELVLARIGKRNRMAEWKIRSIEECRQAAAEIRAKFVTKESNG